jgi:hypothetical protein
MRFIVTILPPSVFARSQCNIFADLPFNRNNGRLMGYPGVPAGPIHSFETKQIFH